MGVDINRIFRGGGRPLVDLLEFCVMGVQPDPLFAFLVGEYRLWPSAPGAIALYEVFCAEQAPARISVQDALPPRNLRIRQDVEPLKARLLELERMRAHAIDPEATGEASNAEAGESADAEPSTVPVPARYLFDTLAARVWENAQLRTLAHAYNPELSPFENLPGGRMSGSQKHFVDNVWEPHLRPYLVSAGFRRVANIA